MQKISKDIPFYPDPTYRPPPKPVRIPMSEVPGNIDINPWNSILISKKIPIFKKVLYWKHTKDQINNFSQEPQELESSSQYRQASTEILT